MHAQIYDAVWAAGYEPWVQIKNQLFYTDGKRIGSLSWNNMTGIHVSAVWKPHPRYGTGAATMRKDVSEYSLREAFILADIYEQRHGIRKWRSWEEFHNSCDFMKQYKLAERSSSLDNIT